MGKSENIIPKQELMLRLENSRLFEALYAQLKKDVRMAGMDDESIAGSTPSDLLDSLKRFLDDHLRRNPEALRHLFYRIDLSEEKLIEALSGNSSLDVSTDLTLQIVMRELKKISDRKKYSGN